MVIQRLTSIRNFPIDKKILAIVGIFFLDLVFLMAIGGAFATSELITAVQPPPLFPFREPVSSVTLREKGVVEEVAQNELRVEKKRIRPSTARVETTSRNYKPVRIKRPSNSHYSRREEIAPPFRDTIIWVKAVRKFDDSEHSAVVSKPIRRPVPEFKPKKRSVFARTVVPVVKKPYEWMRSLVSKL